MKIINEYNEMYDYDYDVPKLTDLQVKQLLSYHFLKNSYGGSSSTQNMFATILFDENNKVDWQRAYKVALHYHPELTYDVIVEIFDEMGQPL